MAAHPLAPSAADLAQAYRSHEPELAGHAQAEGVHVDGAGISVLLSANPSGEGEETRLVRLSDVGDVLWERKFGLEGGAGRAIAALPGGELAIAGDVRCGELQYQAQMLLVSADGQIAASQRFGTPGVTGFLSVAAFGTDSILAAGMSEDRGYVVCIDYSLRTRWHLKLDDVDAVRGVVPSARGGFALAASQEMSTTGLGMTQLASFDSNAKPVWRERLPRMGRGEPAGLVVVGDTGFIAVGHHSENERDKATSWIVHVDLAGTTLWERLLGDSREERRGRAAVAFDDGSVAVVADALQNGARGLRVARLAADGAELWEQPYGGGAEANDVARGIARTPDGGLVVVGSTATKGPGKTNAWVLRLDGHGKLLWDRAFGCVER